MKEYRLSKKALFATRTMFTLACAGLICVGVAAFFIIKILGVALISSTLFLFAAGFFMFIPLWIKSWVCYITSDALLLKRGILIKVETIYPLSETAFAEKVSTPIFTIFGLCFLRLRAVRGSILLPLLQSKAAEEILALLRKGAD